MAKQNSQVISLAIVAISITSMLMVSVVFGNGEVATQLIALLQSIVNKTY